MNRYVGIYQLVLSLACEKFTGFNYDTESIGQKSRIYGTVVNAYFPYEPVVNARIELGYMVFYSDSMGKFDVDYILSTDDNRNQPVALLVSASNFHNLRMDFTIEVPEQRLLLEMDYGAPKIERIWIGVPEEVVNQVRVTDNQGTDNIASVVTTLYYSNMFDPLIKTRVLPMNFVNQVPGSSVSAYYQVVEIPTYGEGWIYNSRWIHFVVRDKDGFSQIIDKKYSDIMSTDPLFPVQ